MSVNLLEPEVTSCNSVDAESKTNNYLPFLIGGGLLGVLICIGLAFVFLQNGDKKFSYTTGEFIAYANMSCEQLLENTGITEAFLKDGVYDVTDELLGLILQDKCGLNPEVVGIKRATGRYLFFKLTPELLFDFLKDPQNIFVQPSIESNSAKITFYLPYALLGEASPDGQLRQAIVERLIRTLKEKTDFRNLEALEKDDPNYFKSELEKFSPIQQHFSYTRLKANEVNSLMGSHLLTEKGKKLDLYRNTFYGFTLERPFK